MKILLTLLFTITGTTLLACADEETPVCVYEKHNIRFSYDDRWHVEEESGWFSSPYVFLETDDSGLIMVLIMPKEDSKTLREFAVEYSKSANSQMLLGVFKSIGFSNITSQTGHPGIEEKLSLNIFDEDAPMTRQYFSFSSNEHTTYIIIQLDDEELEDISGLEKVLSSFEFIEKK